MEKPELTKEESDMYLKIVQSGTMDDMFDIGYAIGRERKAREGLEDIRGRCIVGAKNEKESISQLARG